MRLKHSEAPTLGGVFNLFNIQVPILALLLLVSVTSHTEGAGLVKSEDKSRDRSRSVPHYLFINGASGAREQPRSYDYQGNVPIIQSKWDSANGGNYEATIPSWMTRRSAAASGALPPSSASLISQQQPSSSPQAYQSTSLHTSHSSYLSFTNSHESKLAKLIDEINEGSKCEQYRSSVPSSVLYGTRNTGSGSYVVPISSITAGTLASSNLSPSSSIRREAVVSLEDLEEEEQRRMNPNRAGANGMGKLHDHTSHTSSSILLSALPEENRSSFAQQVINLFRSHYYPTKNRVDLLSRILASYIASIKDESLRMKLMRGSIEELLHTDKAIYRIRFALLAPPTASQNGGPRGRSPRSATSSSSSSQQQSRSAVGSATTGTATSSSISASSSSASISISSSSSSSELSNDDFLLTPSLLTLTSTSSTTSQQQLDLDGGLLNESSEESSDSLHTLSSSSPALERRKVRHTLKMSDNERENYFARSSLVGGSETAANSNPASLLPQRSIAAKVEETVQALLYASYSGDRRSVTEQNNITIALAEPWIPHASSIPAMIKSGNVIKSSFNPHFPPSPGTVSKETSAWSSIYFNCDLRQWLVSYTALITGPSADPNQRRTTLGLTNEVVYGLISIDIDANKTDINQCESEIGDETTPTQLGFLSGKPDVMGIPTVSLAATHKCYNATSKCVHRAGSGWQTGSYGCECRAGFYPVYSPIELGHVMLGCQACPEGCDTCTDGKPCLANYNWPFRISLLVISMACILWTVLLVYYVHKYRRQKVIKVSSPVFLCITLLGCAIMYFEMAAIFPILDSSWCILTKITRHMGVCLTYSALLLKTWRVSLTFRVKSAHKLKLTDKQLLRWLFPIILCMGVYLGAWTISSPPQAVYLLDYDGLKFRQCDYNWWDHSLAIGEFLFLLWGIKVCWNVRNAESFFNEAKYITWAVYNITVVNIIMIFIHVFAFPNAGPDVKYMFGFIRTQLSTTTTILFVFAPKFWRIARGEGDKWDHSIRNPVIAATFGLNGVGGLVGGGIGGVAGAGGMGMLYDEGVDVYQENEELKEQITKLATQIEIMKIMHMEMNNRHLKQKHHSLAVHAALAAPASEMIKVVSAHPTASTHKGSLVSSGNVISMGPTPVAFVPRAASHHGSVPSIHNMSGSGSPLRVGSSCANRSGSLAGFLGAGNGGGYAPREITVTGTGHASPEYSSDRV